MEHPSCPPYSRDGARRAKDLKARIGGEISVAFWRDRIAVDWPDKSWPRHVAPARVRLGPCTLVQIRCTAVGNTRKLAERPSNKWVQTTAPNCLMLLEKHMKSNVHRFCIAPMMEDADSAIFSDIYEVPVTLGSH